MNCRTHEHRHFERTLRSTDTIPGPRLAEGRFSTPKLLAPEKRARPRRGDQIMARVACALCALTMGVRAIVGRSPEVPRRPLTAGANPWRRLK